MLISALDIYNMKIEVDSLPNQFTLRFPDNSIVKATKNKMIYTNFFWDVLRKYPLIPISKDFYVDEVLGGDPLTGSTHTALIDKIYVAFLEAYNVTDPIEKEGILEDFYTLTVRLQNELPKYTSTHVTTIDILDFIELVDHPVISEQIDKTINTYKSINECYDVVRDVVYNDCNFRHNSVVVAVNAKLVSINQVLQAVAVRGKVTEVDGSILPNAVMSNLTNGLTNLYDFVAESRSAAKSLYFSDSKISDSENIARKLQHLGIVVEDLEYHDCGTQEYLDWTVQGPRYDENGNISYKGDLTFMIGKYYLNDEGTLTAITGEDPNLYNKTIKVRSVLYCKCSNPHNVCIYCFGELGYNKSRFANLGHLSVVTLTQILTQSILCTKHLDFSSLGASIVLNDLTRKYFKTDKEKTVYILNSHLSMLDTKISITMGQLPGLEDIKNIDTKDGIIPSRISAIEYINISYSNNGIITEETVYLAQDNKRVVLTKKFLWYLKINGWKSNNRNDFIFDLSKWDFSEPIFSLPAIEYSYSDHSNNIGSLVESSIKHIKSRCTDKASQIVLLELFSLVNSKININLSLLEVIVYAISIPGFDNYHMGRMNNSTKLGVGSAIIRNRSLGIAYTNITIDKTITSPRSFFKENRPDSILDVYIDPKNYLEHYDIKKGNHNKI